MENAHGRSCTQVHAARRSGRFGSGLGGLGLSYLAHIVEVTARRRAREQEENPMDREVKATVEEIARQVYGTLRGGYNESIYQQAMAIEFRERNIAYEVSNTREVFYKDQWVGKQELDLAVLDGVVIELKAAQSKEPTVAHKAQLAAYLRTTGRQKGIVINFPKDPEATEPAFANIEI